jgi:steroid 5-alpha reductase family enzyme
MTAAVMGRALGAAWLGSAAVMFAVWAVQVRTRNAGWVDAAWAGLIGAIAAGYGLFLPGDPCRRLLVASLAAVWSIRLTGMMIHRLRGREEDARYRRLRERFGSAANRWFFGFFQAQALADALLSLGILTAMANPAPLASPWTAAALAVFFTAVIGETVADRQLAAHRADPANRGKTCRRGLWGASRHPNYFFEWLHWWTYALLSAGFAAGWWSLLPPAVMLFFLLKVTGIPETERQAARSRPDYAEYRNTVRAFFPWFPKEGSHESD